MKIFLLFLFTVVPINVQAATGGKGNGPPSIASQMQAKGMGGGGGGRSYADPRSAPPMDPKRRINEQDCSKPIDLTAGNLKCK